MVDLPTHRRSSLDSAVAAEVIKWLLGLVVTILTATAAIIVALIAVVYRGLVGRLDRHGQEARDGQKELNRRIDEHINLHLEGGDISSTPRRRRRRSTV